MVACIPYYYLRTNKDKERATYFYHTETVSV